MSAIVAHYPLHIAPTPTHTLEEEPLFDINTLDASMANLSATSDDMELRPEDDPDYELPSNTQVTEDDIQSSPKRQKVDSIDEACDIVKYLDDKNILWQPCPIQIIKNQDGTFKKTPRYVCFPNTNNGFMPKQTDFTNPSIDRSEIEQRQAALPYVDHIASDTTAIVQIDVDNTDMTPEISEVVNDWKKRFPYYLSATKKLPHFFVTFKGEI